MSRIGVFLLGILSTQEKKECKKSFQKNGKNSKKSLLAIMSRIVLPCGTHVKDWWNVNVLYVTHAIIPDPECFNWDQLICWILFSENLGNCHMDICIKHV